MPQRREFICEQYIIRFRYRPILLPVPVIPISPKPASFSLAMALAPGSGRNFVRFGVSISQGFKRAKWFGISTHPPRSLLSFGRTAPGDLIARTGRVMVLHSRSHPLSSPIRPGIATDPMGHLQNRAGQGTGRIHHGGTEITEGSVLWLPIRKSPWPPCLRGELRLLFSVILFPTGASVAPPDSDHEARQRV